MALLVHLVVHSHGEHSGHVALRNLSVGKPAVAPVESRTDIPVLVREWHHIDNKTGIPELRTALHDKFVVDIVAGELLHVAFQLVEFRLYAVAFLVVHLCRLVADTHLKVHVVDEMRHRRQSGTQSDGVADFRSYFKTDTVDPPVRLTSTLWNGFSSVVMGGRVLLLGSCAFAHSGIIVAIRADRIILFIPY